ncbi:hypothetical protein VCJ_001372 [Vibrio metoecus]|nr:hypothetical protein VCJ_001372 [Vibrio metoecus]
MRYLKASAMVCYSLLFDAAMVLAMLMGVHSLAAYLQLQVVWV